MTSVGWSAPHGGSKGLDKDFQTLACMQTMLRWQRLSGVLACVTCVFVVIACVAALVSGTLFYNRVVVKLTDDSSSPDAAFAPVRLNRGMGDAYGMLASVREVADFARNVTDEVRGSIPDIPSRAPTKQDGQSHSVGVPPASQVRGAVPEGESVKLHAPARTIVNATTRLLESALGFVDSLHRIEPESVVRLMDAVSSSASDERLKGGFAEMAPAFASLARQFARAISSVAPEDVGSIVHSAGGVDTARDVLPRFDRFADLIKWGVGALRRMGNDGQDDGDL